MDSAWKFFDIDGSGAIDLDEIEQAVAPQLAQVLRMLPVVCVDCDKIPQ